LLGNWENSQGYLAIRRDVFTRRAAAVTEIGNEKLFWLFIAYPHVFFLEIKASDMATSTLGRRSK